MGHVMHQGHGRAQFGNAGAFGAPAAAHPNVRRVNPGHGIPLGVHASHDIPAEPPDNSSLWENLPDWKTLALLAALGYIAFRGGRS